jgi:hypothetical protein
MTFLRLVPGSSTNLFNPVNLRFARDPSETESRLLDRFEGLDFGFGHLVLLAGSINTTLGATRFGGAFMDPKQILQTQLPTVFLAQKNSVIL